MDRRAALRIVLVSLLLLILCSITVQASWLYVRTLHEDYGTFSEGRVIRNGVDFCPDVDTNWYGYTVSKTENNGPLDSPRVDQIVISDSACHFQDDNLLYRGFCTITRNVHSTENVFVQTFEDICLTQKTVAECYVTSIPAAYSAERASSAGYRDASRNIAVIKYKYVACPGSMVCSEGRCVELSAGLPDDQLERIDLPRGPLDSSLIGSMFKQPSTRIEEVITVWTSYETKKEEHYPTVSLPIKTQFNEIRVLGEGDSQINDWFGFSQFPVNTMAGGRCTIVNSMIGAGGLEPITLDDSYDQCSGTNQIRECYIQAEGNTGRFSIEYSTYRCPSGTICEYDPEGDRCVLDPGERDEDGDGHVNSVDCNDDPALDGASTYPGAPDDQCVLGEDGQGIDNDCDGIIDNGCDADDSQDTCDSRGLSYAGTAPDGQCCGDDRDETWNIFTSAAPTTNGCYQGATIPVNAQNVPNLEMMAWTRDGRGDDIIGTGGLYPTNEEIELRDRFSYISIPAKQFHGKTMVLEFEYKEGPRSAEMVVSFSGRADGRLYALFDGFPIYHSVGWRKIRREFDYDVGTAAEALGIQVRIMKGRGLDHIVPTIRNFRIYPKGPERAIYVDNQAFWCSATTESGVTEPTPDVSYNNPPTPGGRVFSSANSKNRCEVISSSSGQNFVCDRDGIWKETPHTETQLRSLWVEVAGIAICIDSEGRTVPCPPPPPPPVPDYDIIGKGYGCCGGDTCWNGMGCTENGDTIARESSRMLCVSGEWQTETFKKDQYNHASPTKACGLRQCFWNGPSNIGAAGDADDECIDNGDFKEDNECVFGSWRSRTSMIATQMLYMTDAGTRSDRYTLFCDTPERAALNLEHSGPFAGVIRNAIYGSGDPADCGIGTGKPCVNNVCVLKFTDGTGAENIAIGLSLNVEPNAVFTTNDHSVFGFLPESASYLADRHYSICDGVIRDTTGWQYFGCDGESYTTGSPTNVWYNPKTRSLIYSPQGITIGRETAGTRFRDALLNPFDSMYGAIRNIFGLTDTEGISSDRDLVAKQVKFDKIYINRDDEQSIKGILQEGETPSDSAMTVEYQNLPVDICTNLERIDCTEGVDCSCKPTLLQKGPAYIEGLWSVHWLSDIWRFTITVKGSAGTSYADKWDDLTSKIRLDSSVSTSGSGPGNPSFSHTVPALEGETTSFIIRDVPNEDEIIGYFWRFEGWDGDDTNPLIGIGGRDRSDVNRVDHVFSRNGSYFRPHLTTINRNFKMSKASITLEIPTEASSGGVTAEELRIMIEEAERERLCRERGICEPLPGIGGT